MARTVKRRNCRAGQSVVECALVLPLVILLVVNVVNFGVFFYAWISVANAARTGVQHSSTAGVTVTGGTPPDAAVVQALVVSDLDSLPNQSSIQVCVSNTSTGAVSCNKGAAPPGAPPAADTAEGPTAIVYAITAVDVTYTYSPLIPTWDFPALNIHTTLPPTKIHRQVRMRMLQ
jgi:Flp pilus assembly protein TadG